MASCSRRSSARSKARRRASRSGFSSSPSRRSASTTRGLLRVEPAERYGEGIAVGMEIEEDSRLYTVTDIAAGKVVLDGNHPLAGMALRFFCQVLSVRTANPDEIRRRGIIVPRVKQLVLFVGDRRRAGVRVEPAAEEFMAISKELEPVQCEKRRLRREIALAEAERRDQDVRVLRKKFAALDADPKTAKLEKRLAELEPRVKGSPRSRGPRRDQLAAKARRSIDANDVWFERACLRAPR